MYHCLLFSFFLALLVYYSSPLLVATANVASLLRRLAAANVVDAAEQARRL